MRRPIVWVVVVSLAVLCTAALAAPVKPKLAPKGKVGTSATKTAPKAGVAGIVTSVKMNAKHHLASFDVSTTDKSGQATTVEVVVTKSTKYTEKGERVTSRSVAVQAKVSVRLVTGIKGGKGTATSVNILKAAPKVKPKPSTKTTTTKTLHSGTGSHPK